MATHFLEVGILSYRVDDQLLRMLYGMLNEISQDELEQIQHLDLLLVLTDKFSLLIQQRQQV